MAPLAPGRGEGTGVRGKPPLPPPLPPPPSSRDRQGVGIPRHRTATTPRIARTLRAKHSRVLPPNGVDFLAKGAAGRAKLLLSRIPAASAAPIPAAP